MTFKNTIPTILKISKSPILTTASLIAKITGPTVMRQIALPHRRNTPFRQRALKLILLAQRRHALLGLLVRIIPTVLLRVAEPAVRYAPGPVAPEAVLRTVEVLARPAGRGRLVGTVGAVLLPVAQVGLGDAEHLARAFELADGAEARRGVVQHLHAGVRDELVGIRAGTGRVAVRCQQAELVAFRRGTHVFSCNRSFLVNAYSYQRVVLKKIFGN